MMLYVHGKHPSCKRRHKLKRCIYRQNNSYQNTENTAAMQLGDQSAARERRQNIVSAFDSLQHPNRYGRNPVKPQSEPFRQSGKSNYSVCQIIRRGVLAGDTVVLPYQNRENDQRYPSQ